MVARRIYSSAAVVLVLAVLGLCGRTGPTSGKVARAESIDLFADRDGDMVPECIELLAQTDPQRIDTDEDGVDDFEEILTYSNHDPSAPPQPVDNGMRVLVTSTPTVAGTSDVFLHLLLRFVNLRLDQIAFEDFYIHANGLEVSLNSVLGSGELHIAQRVRERDGASFLFSIRMSSEDDLRRLLPCTIGARAVLGGRRINTGTLLLPAGYDMAALLPYVGTSLILHPVNTSVFRQDENPYYRGGGRVCEMGLSPIGSSSGGTVCEVDWARCTPAAGLRCTSTCETRTGTTVVIPDGLATITGR